ncbi:galactoside alpha-(1,2)-fucosyltransferase 1-like [Palaemon carinicauda]|uniref:galactoside alpha-(1,2)-fucosyltransferase 1-like n=1 Tax=Palaemon carinicauda TaxID=392227 RepID=UPI0035B68448
MVFKTFHKFFKSPKCDLTQLEKLFVVLLVLASTMLVATYRYHNFLTKKYSTSDLKRFYIIKSNHSVQEHIEENLENVIQGLKAADSEILRPVGGAPVNVSQTLKPNITRNILPPKSYVKDRSNKSNQNAPQVQINGNNKSEDKGLITIRSRNEDFKASKSRKEESRLESTPLNSTCLPVTKFSIPKVDEQECSSHHVIIHDGGQLGNKMCQYVSLYLLRHIFGIRVSITEKMKTILSQFFKNIPLPVQDFKCFTRKTKRIMYDDLYKTLHTKAVEHAKELDKAVNLNLLKESYYIFHHPCPREVITAHRNLMHEVLAFHDDVRNKAKRSIKKALRYINRSWENSTLVTVHVRRRDYTQYIKKHYNLTQLDEVYFQRAFDFFRRSTTNPVFVIVSDDHGWCRSVLEANARDVVVAGSRKDPIIDMAALSLGDHHIISYGTFSFMGAILGHGTIVHPVNDNTLYDHYACADDSIFQPISRDAIVS